MNKTALILTLFSLSILLITPMRAYAYQAERASSFAVASYCNTLALQRLNTYVDERYGGDYTSVADQYDILDRNFSACLSREGYQISPDYEDQMGYNYMHQ